MVMEEMKVLVMEIMMMMIPMKSSVNDGDILPSLGRNFPSRFLPAGELFSLWCFLPRRGGGVYL
jgi:hypothetical protein